MIFLKDFSYRHCPASFSSLPAATARHAQLVSTWPPCRHLRPAGGISPTPALVVQACHHDAVLEATEVHMETFTARGSCRHCPRRGIQLVVHLPQELEHMPVADVVDEQLQGEPPVAARVGGLVADDRHPPVVRKPSGNCSE